MKDLGCQNGWDWKNKPVEWIYHINGKNHIVKTRELGRSYVECVCETCGIIWTVDSGD